MRRGLLGYVVWCGLAAFAPARDIFVNNLTGDDRALGSHEDSAEGNAGPVRSISKALRLAAAGDRIVVANTEQPYRETLSLTGSRHSSSLTHPFVIEGNGATLDGSVPIEPQFWEHFTGDVFAFRPARMGYQQLFISGVPAARRPAAPSDISLPRLEPLEWCWWDGRIFFRVENGSLPSDYELSCCGLQTGITLYHVGGVVIENLAIEGFHVDGVNVHDVVRSTSLIGLTCRGNGRSGISVCGASRVEIRGCELRYNNVAQLRSEGFSKAQVIDCEVIGNTAPAFEQRGGELSFSTTDSRLTR